LKNRSKFAITNFPKDTRTRGRVGKEGGDVQEREGKSNHSLGAPPQPLGPEREGTKIKCRSGKPLGRRGCAPK